MPGILRSILAVFAGLVTVVALSEGPDALLRSGAGWFGDHPPDYQFVTATIYRAIAGIAGGYVAAALAPSRALTHAIALGVIGLLLSVAGVVANMTYHLGPDWYPIALAIIAFPSAWLGGYLRPGNTRASNTRAVQS